MSKTRLGRQAVVILPLTALSQVLRR